MFGRVNVEVLCIDVQHVFFDRNVSTLTPPPPKHTHTHTHTLPYPIEPKRCSQVLLSVYGARLQIIPDV